MRPSTAKLEQRLDHLWWLEPAWLFALVVGGTICVAAAQSDSAYRLYGAPKFLSGKHVALAAAAIAAFAFGYRVAMVTGRKPRATPRHADGIVSIAFWLTTVLTIVGYAAWGLVAVRNGLSLGMLREFLSSSDPEVWEQLSKEIFVSWKGVTTATQFAVAAVPLGTWLFLRGNRFVIWPLAGLFILAVIRAVVFSERLAIIELIMPVAMIGLRSKVLGKSPSPVVRHALQLAPLLGVAGLFVFFGGSEYLRSWRYYQHEFDSYVSFTTWRIAGYYSTAHNNGAMALETLPAYPLPYATVRSLWLIPGLSTSPYGYQAFTGMDPAEEFDEMLQQVGTPELNNEGGLFQPARDYGLGGYLLFWLASGFAAGRLYRHFLVGTLAGLTLYPLVIIAILETPRFLYLSYTRSFPALIALGLVLWIVHARTASQRVAAPAVAIG